MIFMKTNNIICYAYHIKEKKKIMKKIFANSGRTGSMSVDKREGEVLRCVVRHFRLEGGERVSVSICRHRLPYLRSSLCTHFSSK